jgi:hypothetical protein
MASIVSGALVTMPFFLQKDPGDPQPIDYSATQMRTYTQSILSRTGVLGSNHFLVSEADTIAMAIKVQSGYAHVGGGAVAYIGEDQTITLDAFTKNPPTPRTHKVYISAYDALQRGAMFGARIDIVQDEGGGAGTPPDAAWYQLIASIAVGVGQTTIQDAHITDERWHGGCNVATEASYLTPETGYEPAGLDYGGFNLRALYTNGIVRLSGAVKRTAGDFPAGSSHTIATLSRNLRPRRKYYLPGALEGSTTTWRLEINTDGAMTATIPSDATPARLIFDGMSYELD